MPLAAASLEGSGGKAHQVVDSSLEEAGLRTVLEEDSPEGAGSLVQAPHIGPGEGTGPGLGTEPSVGRLPFFKVVTIL